MKKIKTEEFDKYVANYDMSDAAIDRKYHHTYRVMENCLKIAECLNLDDDKKYMAVLCGLLHDIGRFEQWRVYKSYQDWSTVDHGDNGVLVLEENNLFERFEEDPRIKEIILFAIKNHNKREIEETNDSDKLLITKIIRDADKIDIILTQHNELKEGKYPLNEYFLKDLYDGKTCDRSNLQNEIDHVLAHFGFLFDINYNQTFGLIKESNVIDKKFKVLRNSIDDERIDELEEYINNYIDRKLEE